MVVRMRKNKSQRDSRRSQQGYKKPSLIVCPECKAKKTPHRLCDNCGTYKGRKVIDVNAEVARKSERKAKKKLGGSEEEKTEKKKKIEDKK